MTTSLFLTPSPPLPATQGAPMRNLSMIRAAATRGPVDLITFAISEPAADSSGDEALATICRRVARMPVPRRSTVDRITFLAKSRLPDMAHRLWLKEFQATLREWLGQEKYDIVQIEGIELARYLSEPPPRTGPRVAFDDHNVEYLLQQRAFEFDRTRVSHLHAAAYSAIQTSRIRRFERQVCQSVDAVLAVSDDDAERLRNLAGCEPTVIPNAIDLAAYPVQPERAGEGHTLLFPGTMSFRPNADAAMWFIEWVFPRLATMVPDVQCFFAGRGPRAELVRRGQHDRRIAVTGEIESMMPYWHRTTLCILPLQVGGGSRFKALEAMALGVPIVATGLAMEGIDARAGHDYLRADDPASFAEAVRHLLEHRSLRRELAAHARQVVERGYTQAVVTARLSALYARLGA